MNVAEFIAKWRRWTSRSGPLPRSTSSISASSSATPSPPRLTPPAPTSASEKGAAKHGGGDGFADVWKRVFFGWEYKGKHKDLEAAFDHFFSTKTLSITRRCLWCATWSASSCAPTSRHGPVTYDVPLERLGESRSLEILHHVFFDPEKLKPGKTSEIITQDAADRFAGIADSMRAAGSTPPTSPTSSTAWSSASSPKTSACCRT